MHELNRIKYLTHMAMTMKYPRELYISIYIIIRLMSGRTAVRADCCQGGLLSGRTAVRAD